MIPSALALNDIREVDIINLYIYSYLYIIYIYVSVSLWTLQEKSILQGQFRYML